MPLPFAAWIAKQLAQELIQGAMGELQGLSLEMQVHLDLEKFGRLKKRLKVAVIRGCNRAAKPVRAAVEAHATGLSRFGFLGKSVGTITRVYPDGRVVTVVGPKMSYARNRGVFSRGPRKGQARKHIPYLYAWLLEKGTRHAGPRKFLQPAWDEAGRDYPERVRAEVEAEVAKVLR